MLISVYMAICAEGHSTLLYPVCHISEFGCDDGSTATVPTMVTVIVFSNTSDSLPDALSEPG